jgi:hypothetical protein
LLVTALALTLILMITANQWLHLILRRRQLRGEDLRGVGDAVNLGGDSAAYLSGVVLLEVAPTAIVRQRSWRRVRMAYIYIYVYRYIYIYIKNMCAQYSWSFNYPSCERPAMLLSPHRRDRLTRLLALAERNF